LRRAKISAVMKWSGFASRYQGLIIKWVTHNEAMTLLSVELWKHTEKAEKSSNGNNVL